MASHPHAKSIPPRVAVYGLLALAVFCSFINLRSLYKPQLASAYNIQRGDTKAAIPFLSTIQKLPYEPSFTDERVTKTEDIKPIGPDVHIPPLDNGLAPVISRIDTKEPVVFLGIDDGAYKDPSVIALMQQNHIHATLFLANLFIHADPNFFNPIVANGSLVEDHTENHILGFSGLSYAQQRAEICNEADIQQQQFGRRPILFRPPGGDWNIDTQRAAADCGMKAVVNWIAKANGGSMQYQVGDKLRPGDIVLMHFRPEFAQDMAAFVAAEQAAGLHTELLEGWL